MVASIVPSRTALRPATSPSKPTIVTLWPTLATLTAWAAPSAIASARPKKTEMSGCAWSMFWAMVKPLSWSQSAGCLADDLQARARRRAPPGSPCCGRSRAWCRSGPGGSRPGPCRRSPWPRARRASLAAATLSVAMNVFAGSSGGLRSTAIDRDAGLLGVLDRHAGRGGTGGDVDDRVDLLGDEVLDLVDLGGGVAPGVGDDDLDALPWPPPRTDCLIWLKKSACRLATARPMLRLVRRSQRVRRRPVVAQGRRISERSGLERRRYVVERGRWLTASVRAAAQDVEHDGERDDDADDDLLDERRHAQQVQPVAQHADDQHAEGRAADGADAAVQAAPPITTAAIVSSS